MCCGLRPFVDIAAAYAACRLYCAFSSCPRPPCVALNALSGGVLRGSVCSPPEKVRDRRIIRAAIIPVPAGRSAVRESAICATFLSFFLSSAVGTRWIFPSMTGSSFRTSPAFSRTSANFGDRITAVHGDVLWRAASGPARQVCPGRRTRVLFFVPDDGLCPFIGDVLLRSSISSAGTASRAVADTDGMSASPEKTENHRRKPGLGMKIGEKCLSGFPVCTLIPAILPVFKILCGYIRHILEHNDIL